MVAFEDAGFLVRDVLAWEKSSAHYRAQSLGKLYARRGMHKAAEKWSGWRLGNLAPVFEPIIWMFKPYKIGGTIADNVLEYGVGAMNTEACQTNGRNPSNVLRVDFARDEQRYHAAQKPVSLLDYLIRLTTPEGAVVLDPFAGSGSTGVACGLSGRGFIGIEQDEGHAAVARRRIAEMTAVLIPTVNVREARLAVPVYVSVAAPPEALMRRAASGAGRASTRPSPQSTLTKSLAPSSKARIRSRPHSRKICGVRT
jgi:DNA modification methylase